MAPSRRSMLSRKSLNVLSDSPNKENAFLRGINAYQVRVRRRESLRNVRSILSKVRYDVINYYLPFVKKYFFYKEHSESLFYLHRRFLESGHSLRGCIKCEITDLILARITLFIPSCHKHDGSNLPH